MLERPEKIKRKFIKKMKLDSIKKTTNLIKKYLDKMTYSQLITTEEFVLNKQKKNGIDDGNTMFLTLVKEYIKEREENMNDNEK
jgi:hypothetical protein